MLMWIANWAARHAPTPEKQAERAPDFQARARAKAVVGGNPLQALLKILRPRRPILHIVLVDHFVRAVVIRLLVQLPQLL